MSGSKVVPPMLEKLIDEGIAYVVGLVYGSNVPVCEPKMP